MPCLMSGFESSTGVSHHAVGGTNANTTTQAYQYDSALDYLTRVEYSDSTYATWSYDAAGNRSNSGYTYDALNRMTASPSHSYVNDVLGNRTWRDEYSSSTVKYQWDDTNRMKQMAGPTTGATYKYRADGMRVKKVTGYSITWNPPSEGMSGYYDEETAENLPTLRYYYDGQMPFEDDYTAETYPTGTINNVTQYGIGARGFEYIRYVSGSSSSVQYPIYDGHGNMVLTVRKETNGSYAYKPTVRRECDPWGEIRTQTTESGYMIPQQKYCANLGHRDDDESGLTYMRARYYEPGTGRFISEDPARDGVNWFSYCGNDPTDQVDMTGRSPYLTLAKSLMLATLIAKLILNARISECAAVVGGAGLTMLSYWFYDRYFTANPAGNRLKFAGMFITSNFLFEEANMILWEEAGKDELESGIAAKAVATFENYSIIMALFIFLEFVVEL